MLRKRLILGMHDAAWLLLAATALNATAPTTALAYVDPSVMTYTIQALAGVAVALSAVIGLVFRRTRRMLLKALHIDENAGKFVEPDVSEIEPSEAAAVDARYRALLASDGKKAASGSHFASREEDLRWRTRFGLSLLVVGALVFTVMVVSPFELIAGNEDSLVYGLADVWSIFVLPTLVVWLVGSLLLSAFKGGAFNVVLMLVAGFTIASYCQVFFLNTGLPSADGSAVDWTAYTKRAVVSTLVWVAIAAVPLVVSAFNAKRTRMASCLLCGVLVIVQAVGVASVTVSSFRTRAEKGNTLTEEGMLTVSSKNNIIVFVLDQYDTVIDLMPALQGDPDLLSEMTGFTWYQNATAVITPTRDAIPSMLNSRTISTQHTEGATDQVVNCTNYLSEIKDAGYSVGVYDDLVDASSDYLDGIAMNDTSREDMDVLSSVDTASLYKSLLSCGLLRDLPWVFKPFFWFYTDDVNQAMVSSTDSTMYNAANTTYVTDDAAFATKLHIYGLAVTDDENGAFRFIHLNGAHNPYVINENEETDENATREQQAIGAMNIVRDYIRQLKELGLYDSATIVITADHGRYSFYNTGDASQPYLSLPETSVPIMLVKPSESSTDAVAALKVSTEPVSNDDVMPTVVSFVDGLPVTTGDVNLLAATDENRVRYFYQLSKDEAGEHGVVEYEIIGDANDFSNWRRTGWVKRYPEQTWTYVGE